MQLRQMIGRVSAVAVLLWISTAAVSLPMHAQQLPAMPNAVRNQLSQAGNPPAATPAPAPQTTTNSPASPKPAQPSSPAPAKAAKSATSKAPKAAGAPSATPAAAQHEPARRDPFESLIKKDTGGAPVAENLPAGKAGLMIATLRVDGIVRGPNGMIVVVTNPQERVYFLREGDRLYDGQVERVDMSGVLFHQTGQDAFGKPVEHDVTKRLYPTPGEQQ